MSPKPSVWLFLFREISSVTSPEIKKKKTIVFRQFLKHILKTNIFLLWNTSFVFYLGAVYFDLIFQTEKDLLTLINLMAVLFLNLHIAIFQQ